MASLKHLFFAAALAGFVAPLPGALAQLSVIHTFVRNADGGSPTQSRLTFGSDGAIYGATPYDGPGNYGTVYRLTVGGEFSLLHAFTNGADGGRPFAGLTEGDPGIFFGSTVQGGDSQNDGVAFMVTATGGFATVHTFSDMPDGSAPGHVALLKQSDGTFIGSASTGGPGTLDSGKDVFSTVFSLTPGGTVTTLYAFNPPEGTSPQSLIQGNDGALYGTAGNVGANGAGTIFRLSGGALTTLYSFTVDHQFEESSAITQGTDGAFYGTTSAGGANKNGIVFRITADGAFTVLHEFSALVSGNNAEGAAPIGGLVQAADGNFYGTASAGGDVGFGTIFKVTPAGAVSAVHAFKQDAGGFYPKTPLAVGPDGALYGTTTSLPDGGVGTVFRFGLKSAPVNAAVVTLALKGDGLATVGGGKGKVAFARTGDTSADLTVSFTIDGTAQNGVDYEGIPNTLTIPAGSANVKLKIKALPGAANKAKIKLALAPSADGSYTGGSVTKAKIKIVNP